MEELTFADYTILAGIISVIVAAFLAFIKKPSWGKKDYFKKQTTVDRDVLMVFGGVTGANYMSMIDRKTPLTVYSDGTVDIKLVDGTELKHVDLEKNIKVVRNLGLLTGLEVLVCNIDATNRIREWATHDVIKSRVEMSLKMREQLKAQGREEAFDILEIKSKYGELGPRPPYD